MNHFIPDLDQLDPQVAAILGRIDSIDPHQLFHLYNQIQARLIRGATPGQIRALASPFEREIEHYRTTGSIADQRPNLGEVATRKAKDLLLDETLSLTHGDKALIAGFILTETKEAEEFHARTVNDFLASLGLERIGNITAALTALESQDLLEMVEKSGQSAQGQKRHRLTTSGYSKATRLLGLRDAA